MPKYLLEVSYSPEGTKGLLKDGGSKRRAAASLAINASGAVSVRTTVPLTPEEIDGRDSQKGRIPASREVGASYRFPALQRPLSGVRP